MRVELHSAFVLHHRPYRETSLLVELFSSLHGRIGLVAKGAKRPRSPLRGVLRTFRPLLVAWSGRGELVTLIAAEPAGEAFELWGRKLLSAFYLNEILMRLLHRNEAYGDLFLDYQNALRGLSGPSGEEPILRIFEKRMLAALGYGLVLDRVVDTRGNLETERYYHYQRDKGPWSVPPQRVATVSVRGKTLLALAKEELEHPEILRESKLLMRFVLRQHLGDKPLASRELFVHEMGGKNLPMSEEYG
jgi:DNA repair protein RecO (recombination protein O)